MQRDYLSVAETAKLVRQALKESFPGIKFGVRSKSYSGGASINVDWTDGPNVNQVEWVTSSFEGAYFDGSIDYKGNKYHALDGRPISFGADFIFESRSYSDAAFIRALRTLQGRYPGNYADVAEKISAEAFKRGDLWSVPFFGGAYGRDNVQAAINGELSKQSDRLTLAKSPTLERVRFRGDDGYGQGRVGKLRPQLQVIAGGAA